MIQFLYMSVEMLSHHQVIHKRDDSRVRVTAREGVDIDRKNLLPEEVYAEKIYSVKREFEEGSFDPSEFLLTEMYLSSVLGSFENYIIPLIRIKLRPRSKKLSLFYPYASLSNLEDFKSKDYTLLKNIYENIEKALHRLHSIGFGHFDIKPMNILITRNDKGSIIPLLTDFGLCHRNTAIKRSRSVHVITPFFRPLYMVNTRVYNENADYWSLGLSILTHILSLLKDPSEEDDMKDIDMGKLDKCITEWKRGPFQREVFCQEVFSAIFDEDVHIPPLYEFTDDIYEIVVKAFDYLVRGQHYDEKVIKQPTLENPSHSEKLLLRYLEDIISEKNLLLTLKFLRQWYPDDIQVDTIYFISLYEGYEFRNKEREMKAKKYAYTLIASLTLCLGKAYVQKLEKFTQLFIYSRKTYHEYLSSFASILGK